MGLFLLQKVDQGMHISGGGYEIDMIIKSINGNYKFKKVEFEVRGHPNIDSIDIDSDDGLVLLIEGGRIAVRDRDILPDNQVSINYKFDSAYKLDKIE